MIKTGEIFSPPFFLVKRKRQVSAEVAKWRSINEQVKEEMTFFNMNLAKLVYVICVDCEVMCSLDFT